MSTHEHAAGATPLRQPPISLVPPMTRRRRFFLTWKAWARGLEYAMTAATSARVRFTLALDIKIADHDEVEYQYLQEALPGWTVTPVNGSWIRCVPPSYR